MTVFSDREAEGRAERLRAMARVEEEKRWNPAAVYRSDARIIERLVERVARLEEGIAAAMTSLETGPAKDGYAYAVLAALSTADREIAS